MLEAFQLKKSFYVKEGRGLFQRSRKWVHAVNGISLSVAPGEIVGLLGVNGAGKTTTIKMLTTLLTPDEGKITIDGLDALAQPNKVKQKVNMIAGGERMLYWRLNAYENLDYFGRLYGLRGAELRARCAALIRLVGLEEAAGRPVERYSKGMKQRLQIARGLINDPDYLFLDEPTLGLDALVARQLRQTVKNLAKQRGKGILLTSHYLEEVEELCDRVCIIDHGQMLLAGTPDTIIAKVVGGFHAQAVLDAKPPLTEFPVWLESLKKQGIRASLEHVDEQLVLRMTSDFDSIPLFLELASRHGLRLKKLEAASPTLEDAIIQLAEGVSV